LRHEAGDCGGVAGVLLVTERDHAHAGSLQLARQIGNRDARQAEYRVDAVYLERVNDELKPSMVSCAWAGAVAALLSVRCPSLPPGR
jgi:hypothetical protein